MPKALDLTGATFGRLTVMEFVGNRVKLSGKRMWRCACRCGKTTVIDAGSLRSGNTQSCGCYLKECITKHGGWKKSSYFTWRAMMRRCYNEKDKDFGNYGGRGIVVDVRWWEYANFEKDMGEPQGTRTLDRINNDFGYFFDNCRWATPLEQNRNRRLKKYGVRATPSGKYYACIVVLGVRYRSECFVSKEDAVAARRHLEEIHWNA